MRHAARFQTITAVLLLLAADGLAAEDSAPRSTPPAPQTGPPAKTGADGKPSSNLRIRVYEGFGTLGPIYDHGGVPPYAVDVGVAMKACPDGNTEISSLDIGGWTYQLGTACDEGGTPASSGSVTVRSTARAPAAGPQPSPPHVIRCNPNSWNCAPTTR